nr:receptor-interacting serine/threonine-protein kinase 3-like [Anolis sagrei ordinatus]
MATVQRRKEKKLCLLTPEKKIPAQSSSGRNYFGGGAWRVIASLQLSLLPDGEEDGLPDVDWEPNQDRELSHPPDDQRLSSEPSSVLSVPTMHCQAANTAPVVDALMTDLTELRIMGDTPGLGSGILCQAREIGLTSTNSGHHVDKLQLDSPSVGLVMEYMENGSLSDLMSQVNFIPWALRFRILFHVALGMNYLHNLSPPLLHLDLKLGNILLDAVLDAKVADFGLSKFKRGTIRSGSQASVEEEEYGGTLEYLPPEAFADPYKPTPGTDVYSYGIVTWSLLSGEEPYSNLPDALRSLIKLHIPRSERPSTEKLEKIVDVLKVQDVVKLMKRCWHNDKVQRPSFRDCREEMEAVSSCYQGHIMAAVHEVQNILVQKKSSLSSTSKRDSLTPRCSDKVDLPSSLNTYSKKVEYQPPLDTSVGIEDHFKTLRVEESSYRPNEATPPATVSKTRQEGKPPESALQ